MRLGFFLSFFFFSVKSTTMGFSVAFMGLRGSQNNSIPLLVNLQTPGCCRHSVLPSQRLGGASVKYPGERERFLSPTWTLRGLLASHCRSTMRYSTLSLFERFLNSLKSSPEGRTILVCSLRNSWRNSVLGAESLRILRRAFFAFLCCSSCCRRIAAILALPFHCFPKFLANDIAFRSLDFASSFIISALSFFSSLALTSLASCIA
mmetsp:Transcript_24130/g.38775  ORF Transcript_24130/g.38775 Transcript_24130/m.38775 type:complete len:206 (+) Transcript_24130:1075-1692(+)